ncbi:MAG TPA: hypothetical protein VGM23_02270 [Armatimonadota bacterium]|jgi:hypothetical protein
MKTVPMTSAAYAMGFRNFGIVGLGLLLVYAVLTLVIQRITRLPFWPSFLLGFGFSWVCILAYLATSILRNRGAGGPIVLDCGSYPLPWLCWLNAGIWVLLAFAFSVATPRLLGTVNPVVLVVIPLSFAAFYLYISFTHIQLREQGIRAYVDIIRWEKVKSYRWKDNTILIEYKTRIPFLGKGALPVRPEQQEAAETILREYVGESAEG